MSWTSLLTAELTTGGWMHEPGSWYHDAIPQKTYIILLCYCRPAGYFSHESDINDYCYHNMHTHPIFLCPKTKIKNKINFQLLWFFLLHCCDHVSVVYPSRNGAQGHKELIHMALHQIIICSKSIWNGQHCSSFTSSLMERKYLIVILRSVRKSFLNACKHATSEVFELMRGSPVFSSDLLLSSPPWWEKLFPFVWSVPSLVNSIWRATD